MHPGRDMFATLRDPRKVRRLESKVSRWEGAEAGINVASSPDRPRPRPFRSLSVWRSSSAIFSIKRRKRAVAATSIHVSSAGRWTQPATSLTDRTGRSENRDKEGGRWGSPQRQPKGREASAKVGGWGGRGRPLQNARACERGRWSLRRQARMLMCGATHHTLRRAFCSGQPAIQRMVLVKQSTHAQVSCRR